MHFHSVLVSDHAVEQMAARFYVGAGLPLFEAKSLIADCIGKGVVIGGQLGRGLAVEIPVPSGRAYAVGQLEEGTFIVTTVLTKDLLAANMGAFGISGPGGQPKRRPHSRRCRRNETATLKTRCPWKFDRDHRDMPNRRPPVKLRRPNAREFDEC